MARTSPIEDPSLSSSRPTPGLSTGYTQPGAAGPSTLVRQLDAPAPHNPSLDWGGAADTMTESHRNNISSRPKQSKRKRSHDHRDHSCGINTHDDYTRNDGNRNKTYQRSYVSKRHGCHTQVYVIGQERASTFPSTSHTLRSLQDIPLNITPSPASETSSTQQSSSLQGGESTSPPNSHTAPSPQETLLNPTPTRRFSGLDSLQKTQAKEETQTRSERYESLLLRCKLGFPLWTPSPRCTPDGEYTLDIGDVGVLTHGLPFNTIFNITQPRNSPANRDGIPAGVDPPCVLGSRGITISKPHPSEATLIQPRDAIPKQALRASKESSVFTFHLSGSGGALLMLPQGGTRHTLVATTEFRTRVGQYWKDWYEFAKGKVDLEEGQALYLVTGFERCSTWAMAVWDSISTYKHDEPDSLELTVVKSTGACSWAYPPARCSTQSLSSLTANSDSLPLQNQETVFIRGFRIDLFDGSTTSQSPTLLSVLGQEKNRNSDSDPNSRGSDSCDHSAGGGSSLNLSTSTHPSFRGGGRSRPSDPQSDSLGPLVDEARILELELDDQDLSNGEDGSITHPCHIINKLAFLLISKTEPALLNAGCVALSHDEDWISIVRDSDEGFPSNAEIVKRICSEFKFTIDGDIIYTASMTDLDKNFLEKSETTRLRSQSSLLSVTVLVVFASSHYNRYVRVETKELPLEKAVEKLAIGSSNSQQEWFVSAPGKVILFGEHAVVHGVTAIAASVDLRCYGLLTPRDDGKVSVFFNDISDFYQEWDIKSLPWGKLLSLPMDQDHPEDLDQVLIDSLHEGPLKGLEYGRESVSSLVLLYLYMKLSRPGIRPGFDFTARSTLPVGAGLGSSASFSSCAATALLLVTGRIRVPELPPHSSDGHIHVSHEGRRAIPPNMAKRINKWAYTAEKILRGNPSGVDNSVSVYGGALGYVKEGFGKKSGMEPITGFKSLRFLLTNTKVSRDTKKLVAGVGQMKLEEPELVDSILKAVQHISEEAWRALADPKLSRKDLISGLAALITENHNHLVTLKVSHPALEAIREKTAAPPYGLSTKLTGAGGGGCAVTLIPDDFKAEALRDLIAELSANDFDPYITSVGGSGLGILSPYEEHRNKQAVDGLDDTIQGAFKVRKITELTPWANDLGRWLYV
ncbi:cystathionine beta-lyase [Marasmius sp. AFHP31]|nr:cystathionine beta-lyase [Marasmius sp. AFHP31]